MKDRYYIIYISEINEFKDFFIFSFLGIMRGYEFLRFLFLKKKLILFLW